MYKGFWMRSRVEARWAAWFDEQGWSWVYEPFDLRRYIPDFLVTRAREQVLVEIKGDVTRFEELAGHRSKIDHSGWDGTVLLLGAAPFGNVLGEVRVLGYWSPISAVVSLAGASNATQWRPRIVESQEAFEERMLAISEENDRLYWEYLGEKGYEEHLRTCATCREHKDVGPTPEQAKALRLVPAPAGVR